MTAGEPKKTIAIVVYPERGALYPTFALAKALAGRGHRVIYFGVVDFEDDVRRQGLEHVTLFGDVFGRGTMDREPEPPARRLRDRVRRLRASAARDGRQLEALKAELVDGKATALLREHGVDLVLVETSVALFLAPSLVVAGFPTVGLSIELYSPAPVVPPTFTPILADGTPQSALRARAAWAQHWLELRATQAVVAAGSASGFFPRRLFFGSTNERFRQLRRASGLRWSLFEYGWRPILPELVLSTRLLELPGEDRAPWPRAYAGHSIDLSRVHADLPELEGDSRPLVYTSLGTHAAEYPHTPRILASVFEIARQRPDLRFVVALGRGRRADEFGDPPPNVVARPLVPQLRVLERADVMVTNSGLGTVKECLYFGVPIVALPCKWEQTGTAARVAQLGVGVRDDVRTITTPALRAHVERCLSDEGVRRRAAEMKRHMRASDELDKAIGFVEEHARVQL
jgi:zeaxanthin glucosyltransferase